MAYTPRFSDDDLRQYLDLGMSHSQVAKLLKVSPSAITYRVKLLEKRAAARTDLAQPVAASLWDTKAAAEENYQRCLSLYLEAESAADKARVLSEIRQHLQFATDVQVTLYNIQELQGFMDSVLSILENCDPELKRQVLSRIRARRDLGAALAPA